ncbi:MAG: type II toxin-antitoxin system PemK/MazF family toxin [Bacillota bacterium]
MSRIPEQGDIITLEFNPQSGHEQKGRLPAIVVSNTTFNRFTNMAMVCPITNTNRAFPLHVPLDNRTTTTGVIMCEQVKVLDISARNAAFKEKAPADIIEEVVDIVYGFIEVKKSK